MNKTQKNAIILCSGGIDSVTTAYYVKNKLKYNNLVLIFIDYNQKSLKNELYCVRQTSKKLKAKLIIIKLPWLGSFSTSLINKSGTKTTSESDLSSPKKLKETDKIWWVPCRNTAFIISALAYAESQYLNKKIKYNIFVGFKNEGQANFKDQTPEFLRSINNLQKYATQPGNFKIKAPLIKLDKEDIIKLGNKLRINYKHTFSCYTSKKQKSNLPVHCGKCIACQSRKKGFYWSNIKDPSLYKD